MHISSAAGCSVTCSCAADYSTFGGTAERQEPKRQASGTLSLRDGFYFSEGSATPRREVMRIVADNDTDALVEAKRLDGWKQSSFYEVRSINSSARSGDKVIFTSRVEEPVPSDAFDLARATSAARTDCLLDHAVAGGRAPATGSALAALALWSRNVEFKFSYSVR